MVEKRERKRRRKLRLINAIWSLLQNPTFNKTKFTPSNSSLQTRLRQPRLTHTSTVTGMNNGNAMCSPHEERRIVKELIDEANLHLCEGSLYYVVSSRWFSSWERYVGQGGGDKHMVDVASDSLELDTVPLGAPERPGPIDNSDLVEYGGGSGDEVELSRTLLEIQDYALVPQKVWEKLVQWYNGGPALPRRMISEGVSNRKQFSVEVYPLNLKLIDSRDNSVSRIRISKKASVRELYEKVSTLRRIEIEKISLWDYFNKYKNTRLTDLDKSLQESHLHMDQEILLELRNDGSSPSHSGRDSTGNELALASLEPPRSTLTIAGGPITSNGNSKNYSLNLRPGSYVDSSLNAGDDSFNSNSSVRKAEKGGLAGLQNLGNTCFMNSSLQCLVHTPQLVEYFLQNYTEEINPDNPLGMHGELALAFGDLLRKLWSSGRTTVAPRAFKGKLALFAPQFSGYNQHDSQELLAFLLDGLHEDLNRVKQKPYIEMKDWDGCPDEEVADECWRNHKARNDSVIVDVFQGQYKSTLVCPDCSKISITFDPFMYLSLPLPSTVTRSMTVTVFYGDGSGLPMPYTVTVLKHGNCRDLSQVLASACCLRSDESLLLAEVYEHKIYRLLETPLEPLVGIKDEDHIVAYRLSRKLTGKKKLELVHREKFDFLKGNGKHFGTPFITYLEEDVTTGADIGLAVCALLSTLKRTSSATIAHSDKENGFLSVPNGELPNGCNGHFEPSDQSKDDKVEEETFYQELPFQLFSIDDRYLSPKPIRKDTVINFANQRIKVLLEWSEMEHIMYDASYLKDLPEVYHKTGFAAKKTRQEAVSLFSCLEAFLTKEPLGPDDMWYCPKCKEHRQATKKLDLWALPDILVFHLKRFSYSRYMKNKLDTFVDFPIHNLDLTKYVKQKDGESYIYELYAISNHYGGLGGGHYTAFSKLIDENEWYNFDDSRVLPCSESEIKTSAAYVLFYQRVKPDSTMGTEETPKSYPGT